MSLLKGKVAVVTGGGRGLGRVLTTTLAGHGAQVIAMGRGLPALQDTAALCDLGQVTPLPVDLTVAEAVEAAFADIGTRFGKLDILINNAATIELFRLDEAAPEQFARTLNGNFLAPMLTARFGAELLRRSGGGDIINISSESVHNPFSFVGAYAAAKAGLENFSVGLRNELAASGIRVMVLRLGMLDDPSRPITVDAATAQRYLQENQTALQQSGGLIALTTVVRTLMNMLTLPQDASIDLVELRGRRAVQTAGEGFIIPRAGTTEV